MIGIIVATASELEALNQVLGTKAAKPMEYVTGRIGDTEVVGVQGGIGKVNAALCAQKLIDLYHPEAIINVGVAGALEKSLHVGDIVISTDAVQHDFDTTVFGDAPGQISGFDVLAFPADPALIEKAEAAAAKLGYHYVTGRVASGDQFIEAKEKKDYIISQFGAACTEMEGAAMAQAAYVNGVPFVILRAISDGADEGAIMSYTEFVVLAAKKSTALLKEMLS